MSGDGEMREREREPDYRSGTELKFRFGPTPRHHVILLEPFTRGRETHWAYLAPRGEGITVKTSQERFLRNFYDLEPEINWADAEE
jgi:hypothetical protein